ncbi:MAG: SUMF1/EgtB/PvdO family nonheme iron enzyme [Chromatiaceae bacterium]|nr:SUMF1/EgtB/PvdO family nonheme iron enzyme [Chromatiaceae bacterium]
MMHIPGYTIIRELGSGGMATVYLARQDRLGRQVALKVMQPQAMIGDDFASRFRKEGRIIAHLQHPQIVTIYDFDIAEGLHYFSMEYLPNGTLSDQITRGLSPDQAIDITRGIAQALSVAHDQGVIHRDIKPQNVLFRADRTPVLTDFGIARAAGTGPEATQLTNVGMVIGSPRYMSPEQSMSRPIDARSDLYSLGVVLYEMLTRELPYQADDVISLAMKHCSAPIPVLPNPLRAYQPIIEKLLAKHPEDRFGSTQELIRALDALQTGQREISTLEEETRIVPREKPSPKRTSVKSPGSRNLTKTAAIVLILALSIAAGLYFFAFRTAEDPLDHFAKDIGLPPRDAARPEITERYERLALGHLREKELSRGVELVQLALQSNPGDIRLKTLESWADDRIEADKLLREAEIRLDEQSFDESLALIARGLELAQDHQGLKGLREKVLQERAKQNAAQARELLKKAQASYERGDFVKSMKITIDGLVLAPEDTRLKALQARLQDRLEQQRALRGIIASSSRLLDEGRLSEGMKEVERGLASAPGDPELLDLKARILERIERESTEKAEKLLHAAEERLDKLAFDESLALVEQGLELAPHHTELTNLRKRALTERAKYHAAQAAKLLERAQAAFDQDDVAKSLRLCKEGLLHAPEDAQLKALKASVQTRIAQQKELTAVIAQASNLLGQGQLFEAGNIVEEALKVSPESPELLDLKARVREGIEREAVEKAAGLGKEAQLLANRGNFDDALKRLEQALELQPGDSTLQKSKEEVRAQRSKSRADALFDQAQDALAERKLTEALDLTQRGLREQPEHAELQALQSKIQSQIEEERTVAESVAKARALLRKGRYAESLQTVDVALEIYPRNARLLVVRGEVERARSQEGEDQAREALQQASRLVEMGELDAATEWVSKGLESRPGHPELLKIEERIGEIRAKRAEVARLLPEMVVIEAGCFQMGSPESEPNREPDERLHLACVQGFELAKYETRIADFGRFVDAEGYKTDAERGGGGVIGCWALDREAKDGSWGYHAWANWRNPNKYRKPDPNDPVACVSKNDAQAYIQWLNEATGQSFRLPTEAEWEFAARAATKTRRYWENSTDQAACRNANVADSGHDWDDGFPCDDGYEWAAPTGHFAPNSWGLHDMLGNVSEWTCSRYVSGYGGLEAQCAPADSRDPAALRGGGWNSGPAATRAAYRDRNYPESRYNFVGFRLARDAGAEEKATAR